MTAPASILKSESGGSWRAARHFSKTGQEPVCAVQGMCSELAASRSLWHAIMLTVHQLGLGAHGGTGQGTLSQDSKPGRVDRGTQGPGHCQVESRMEVTHEFCLRALSAWCSVLRWGAWVGACRGYLSCPWRFGDRAFTSSSLEVQVVVVFLSEAKPGDYHVLPQEAVTVDPQLQWRQNCFSFLWWEGQKAHSEFNVTSWNRNQNGFSAGHPVSLTLLQPK